MKTPCPECGGDVEMTAAPAKVLSGECAACGHGLTVLEGVRPPKGPSTAESSAEGEDGEEESAEGGGLVCAECGGRALVRAAAEGTIETECSGCGAEATYKLIGAETEEAEAPRSAGRRRERPGPESFDRPASRPCRECGGPLQFRDGPDGGVIGECASCGNRFTLPPRRDGPGRRERPSYSPRSGGRAHRPYRRPGEWRGRGDRGRPGAGRGGRPYRRRDEGDGGTDDRRRRRRRDDE